MKKSTRIEIVEEALNGWKVFLEQKRKNILIELNIKDNTKEEVSKKKVVIKDSVEYTSSGTDLSTTDQGQTSTWKEPTKKKETKSSKAQKKKVPIINSHEKKEPETVTEIKAPETKLVNQPKEHKTPKTKPALARKRAKKEPVNPKEKPSDKAITTKSTAITPEPKQSLAKEPSITSASSAITSTETQTKEQPIKLKSKDTVNPKEKKEEAKEIESKPAKDLKEPDLETKTTEKTKTENKSPIKSPVEEKQSAQESPANLQRIATPVKKTLPSLSVFSQCLNLEDKVTGKDSFVYSLANTKPKESKEPEKEPETKEPISLTALNKTNQSEDQPKEPKQVNTLNESKETPKTKAPVKKGRKTKTTSNQAKPVNSEKESDNTQAKPKLDTQTTSPADILAKQLDTSNTANTPNEDTSTEKGIKQAKTQKKSTQSTKQTKSEDKQDKKEILSDNTDNTKPEKIPEQSSVKESKQPTTIPEKKQPKEKESPATEPNQKETRESFERILPIKNELNKTITTHTPPQDPITQPLSKTAMQEKNDKTKESNKTKEVPSVLSTESETALKVYTAKYLKRTVDRPNQSFAGLKPEELKEKTAELNMLLNMIKQKPTPTKTIPSNTLPQTLPPQTQTEPTTTTKSQSETQKPTKQTEETRNKGDKVDKEDKTHKNTNQSSQSTLRNNPNSSIGILGASKTNISVTSNTLNTTGLSNTFKQTEKKINENSVPIFVSSITKVPRGDKENPEFINRSVSSSVQRESIVSPQDSIPTNPKSIITHVNQLKQSDTLSPTDSPQKPFSLVMDSSDDEIRDSRFSKKQWVDSPSLPRRILMQDENQATKIFGYSTETKVNLKEMFNGITNLPQDSPTRITKHK
ncbi:hypothetical protein NEOKW01_1007 [Nematocida sp. AWRm80]|nr:hypothetical protein NEOKW01_1007 [Nematocida sp. AWRm80]